MTSYEYDNLPEELNIQPVPELLFDDAYEAFKQVMDSGDGVWKAVEAKAAYVYDRKGYLTADAVGGPRNKSYGSDDNDIVIQLTVRVPNPASYPQLSKVAAMEKTITERKLQEESARLEAEIAAEEAAAEKAQATAKQKREQLEALRKK